MANEEKNTEQWHPLFTKDLQALFSWKDWKECWHKATLKEELLGLLHCAFASSKESKEDRAECICLCLDVADGYKNIEHLTLKEEEQEHTWRPKRLEPGMRLEIAQKALRMLVDKAFTNTRKYHWENPTWAPTIAQPAVLEKATWFLTASRFSHLQDSNVPSWHSERHDDTVLRAFVADFVEFCWKFEGFREDVSVEDNQAILNSIKALQPQILEMMAGADQLWYLMRHPRVLDKACLEKLRELALRKVGCDGPFKTLEEALVSGGRMAAQILLLQPIWAGEVKRQQQLARAEKLREEAKYLERIAGHKS